MKIFDIHTHAMNKEPDPKKLISDLENAGIYGCCVFSNQPYGDIGSSFECRLNEVLAWSKGYEERIIPVMWIHPFEPDIIANIHKAVEKGVCAFKIICNDFYVYEEKCLEVLREIASLNLPVFFHSGILWDGCVSSSYNRPLNWEALLNIKGLRFSMGHCSWPWVDECIALYGKFLNSRLSGNTAEMFFDITPGTPEIYREELLTKLYTIGYDVGDNIMFGTDTYASDYTSAWAKKWLDTDKKIMDKLGVSAQCREKLYYKNLLRFLGKSDVSVSHNLPDTDDSNAWSPIEPSVAVVAEKWYKKLSFPACYDEDFYKALKTVPVSDAVTPADFAEETDGKRSFISALYLCEQLSKRYKQKEIPEKYLLDTLSDIRIWTDIWSGIKGELYLGENAWLAGHLDMKLIKIGRLQYCMANSEHSAEKYSINKNDNVLEIHIPATGRLCEKECAESLKFSKEFFGRYFPEVEYKYLTCHSWLLDPTLAKILNNDSNILKFQQLFDIVETEESDDILKYVFTWDTKRYNLNRYYAENNLQKAVKNRISEGGSFLCGFGIYKH